MQIDDEVKSFRIPDEKRDRIFSSNIMQQWQYIV